MIRNFVVPFILGRLYEIAISYTQSLYATIISHITMILYRICLYVRLSYYKCILKRETISNSVFDLTSLLYEIMKTPKQPLPGFKSTFSQIAIDRYDYSFRYSNNHLIT